MHTAVSAEQVDAYRRDGFIVLPELLAASELAMLRNAVEESVHAIGRQRIAGTWEYAEPDDHREAVALQRLNLWKIDSRVRRIFLDVDLGRMLCALSGNEGLRILHDQTFFKPPWGNPTAFHLDMPNWAFSSPHSIQIWIALDDMSARNGCLYFLPASHRLTREDATASVRGDLGALFAIYPELSEVEAWAAEVAAGTAIVHNGLTVHAAAPNMTPHWRRAMTCQYMPGDARFNGNRCILTRSQLARLRVGDLLDDEEHHPLVWPPHARDPGTAIPDTTTEQVDAHG